jgi:hypothetical protein
MNRQAPPHLNPQPGLSLQGQENRKRASRAYGTLHLETSIMGDCDG